MRRGDREPHACVLRFGIVTRIGHGLIMKPQNPGPLLPQETWPETPATLLSSSIQDAANFCRQLGIGERLHD